MPLGTWVEQDACMLVAAGAGLANAGTKAIHCQADMHAAQCGKQSPECIYDAVSGTHRVHQVNLLDPVGYQLHLQEVTNIKGMLHKQEQHRLKDLPASTRMVCNKARLSDVA
jgi:hypothetical protein